MGAQKNCLNKINLKIELSQLDNPFKHAKDKLKLSDWTSYDPSYHRIMDFTTEISNRQNE